MVRNLAKRVKKLEAENQLTQEYPVSYYERIFTEEELEAYKNQFKALRAHFPDIHLGITDQQLTGDISDQARAWCKKIGNLAGHILLKLEVKRDLKSVVASLEKASKSDNLRALSFHIRGIHKELFKPDSFDMVDSVETVLD